MVAHDHTTYQRYSKTVFEKLNPKIKSPVEIFDYFDNFPNMTRYCTYYLIIKNIVQAN